MHTKDLARTLRAFADIADFDKSQELYRLATFLDQGRSETVASRVKRSTPSTRYPLRLKGSLESIKSGLRSAGASRPCNAVGALLTLFAGKPGAEFDAFLSEISTSTETLDLDAPRFKTANIELANRISTELTALSFDEQSFRSRLAEFSALPGIGSATWVLIANQFIGNQRRYRDRKLAIDAVRWHFESLMANREIPAKNGSPLGV